MILYQADFRNGNGDSKEISLHGDGVSFEIITTTESPDPSKVSGVRNRIDRKAYRNEDAANESFDRRVANAVRRGWELQPLKD